MSQTRRRISSLGWVTFGALSLFAISTALPRALSLIPEPNPAVWQAFAVQQSLVIALGLFACYRRSAPESFVASVGTLLMSVLMLQGNFANTLPSLDLPAHLFGGALAGILVLPHRITSKRTNVAIVLMPQLAALALGLGNELLEALSDLYLRETVMFLSPRDTLLDLIFNQIGAGLMSFFILKKHIFQLFSAGPVQ